MKSGLFIPGICGIFGNQGSGKSFSAIKVVCAYANQIQFDICFNFQVDFYQLYLYCIYNDYQWLAHRIYHNKCRSKYCEDLETFFDLPKTIYVMDEAGVYINSRNFKKTTDGFLETIAQVRHDGKIFWYIAQYYEMVDKVLRDLSSSFIHVDSSLRFNKKLGNSEILWQRIYLFSQRNYRIYLEKVCYKFTGVKHWVNARRLSDFQWEGVLSDDDKMLFKVYQSFGSRVSDLDDSQFFFKRHYQQVNSHKLVKSFNSKLPLPFSDCEYIEFQDNFLGV